MGAARPTFRLFIKLISAVALTAALFVGIASVAGTVHAAPQNLSHSYNLYWDFNSLSLNVCIRYRVEGTYTYTVDGTLHGGGAWTNIKLNDPKLTAYVYAYIPGCAAGVSATVSTLEMTQYWSGYACSFNPSISFSPPWSVGISFWPNCGNRNLAQYYTKYTTTSNYYKQSNSGSPGGFGNYYANSEQYSPCYGVYVSSTAYERNISDHFTSPSAKQVCLPF